MKPTEAWRGWRPIETSAQKHGVVSLATDYLLSRGINEQFLKIDPAVLTPPLDSDHWLQGVVLPGYTDIKDPTTSQVDSTKFIYHTPEDKRNRTRHHILTVYDETPVIKGSDLLDLRLNAGIRHVYSGGSAGGDDNYLYVPDKLRNKVDLEKYYRIGAILINFEEQTFDKIIKAHPELITKFTIQTLLATSLTPIR